MKISEMLEISKKKAKNIFSPEINKKYYLLNLEKGKKTKGVLKLNKIIKKHIKEK